MEEIFIEIEEKIAESKTLDQLRDAKMEYFKQHRLVLEYFNFVQEEIEGEGL